MILLNPQTRLDPLLIKPNDDFAAGVDDWYAHLTGFVDHLLALGEV